MKRVLSIVLSAALSLSVLFALPILPGGDLPTDPNPIVTEGEGEDGGNGNNNGEGNQDLNSGIEICEGFPDGGPNIQ